MLYEPKLKQVMLVVLENRMTGIADCITALLNEGYIPNKNKFTIFNWCAIMIDAYENIDGKYDTIITKYHFFFFAYLFIASTNLFLMVSYPLMLISV